MHGSRYSRGRGHWGRSYYQRHGWGHPRGFRGGHRARRGNVRAAILALLGERQMHGYEMIQELEERTGGQWRPSAGSIYPTLQLLADEGLVSSEQVDGKRVFSLTEAGKKAAEEETAEAPPWEEAAAGADSPHGRLRMAAFRLGAAAMQVGRAGTDEQITQAADLLTETRRRLYALLAEE
jgi:DNA-binding PadR family transcriptional regulator